MLLEQPRDVRIAAPDFGGDIDLTPTQDQVLLAEPVFIDANPVCPELGKSEPAQPFLDEGVVIAGLPSDLATRLAVAHVLLPQELLSEPGTAGTIHAVAGLAAARSVETIRRMLLDCESHMFARGTQEFGDS